MFSASRASVRESFRKLGLAALVAATSLTVSSAWARGPVQSNPATVALQDLPPQAQETARLIRAGGPFPYAKDGVVFGNRERMLPRRERGWYREYTVRTPGSRDRGARRIVCGGAEPRNPEACWYSDDHYASFARIAP